MSKLSWESPTNIVNHEILHFVQDDSPLNVILRRSRRISHFEGAKQINTFIVHLSSDFGPSGVT